MPSSPSPYTSPDKIFDFADEDGDCVHVEWDGGHFVLKAGDPGDLSTAFLPPEQARALADWIVRNAGA